MRLTSIMAALIAVTSITSALHLPSTEPGSLERRAPPAKKPVTAPAKKPVAAAKKPVKISPHAVKKAYKKHCKMPLPKSASPKKKIAARLDTVDNEYDEDSNTYTVNEGSFLTKKDLIDGMTLRVDNLSGCSAVFFFDSAGKASAAHISRGTEKVEAKDAAKKAKEAGSVTAVKVYGTEKDTFIYADIVEQVRAVLGATIKISKTEYVYNAGDRTERHGVTFKVGDTDHNLIKMAPYHCTK
jgi:hypothetical protein